MTAAPDPAPAATRLVRGPGGRWVVADTPAEDAAASAPAAHPARDNAAPPDHPDHTGQETPPTRPTGPFVTRISACGVDGRETHAVLLGDSGQPIGQLRDELRGLTGAAEVGVDGAALPEDGVVAALDLRDGVRVHPADQPPAPAPAMPARGPVLRVVGGPDAGRVVALREGEMTIGRAAGNSIVVRDPNVSRSHAVIIRRGEDVWIVDLGSANGTRVEGSAQEQVGLAPGEVVRLGDTLVELGQADEAERVTLESGPDFLGVHRRFRSGVDEPATTIAHPKRKSAGDPAPLNLLMAILPAGGIAAMALALGRPTMLIFAAMSPLIAVGRMVAAKREHRRKTIRYEVEYREALRRFTAALASRRAEERRHRRRLVPDPARVLEAATRPTTTLWSRRATDADALTLRVGSGHAPTHLEVTGAPGPDDEDTVTAPLPTTQPWLPVAASLLETGGLALVGPLERLRPLARSLVLQAATLHAPSELAIVFLGSAEAEADWSWLRWLPHTRRSKLDPSLLLGTDATSRSLRMEELRRILLERREAAGERRISFTPRLLVVYDDASARLAEGAAELLRDGPAVGIHALSLDTLQVPEGCDASLVLSDRVDGARLERRAQPPVRGVITDQVDVELAERAARAMAPVRVVGEDADDGLPTSCRLLSTIELEPTVEDVAARWRRASSSARAVVGVGPERPVSLDLTRDGPHALVAGTTGAGKSEFIKTLVASLAVENHPDDLMFLFIDFKGGGDYRTLVRLPHTVALATNLDDPAALDRTLALLEAEMGRRATMLHRAGTPSIEGYLASRRAGDPSAGAPMPRLVVVADEFAELKDKAPTQLDRLVSVARTGRAVGVHLLLATQKPGGVVTSQIDANVGLRVCFRVKDEAESKEIIDSPLAGRIAERHRGRCYFRSAATPLTEAQTARVAGPRPGSRATAPVRAVPLGWNRVGKPFPKVAGSGEVPDAETDLHDVVEAARGAAAADGWSGAAIPWPPELPARISRAQLPPPEDPDAIGVALVDDPEHQRQQALGISFGAGHVAVAGSGRTGRTTALRTFVAGAVDRYSPADLHIAAIDFGGGGLLAVQSLPHCIGLSMEDLGEAEAITRALDKELVRRRALFARNGWPDLAAQRRRSSEPLPWLLLAIEGWDNLAEEGMKRGLANGVAQLLARGGPQGLQVVLTGDRGTAHSLIARHITHRYALRFNRAVDAELQGLAVRQIPAHQPPGRAVEVASGRLLHIAELDDPDGRGQADAFAAALSAAVAESPSAERAVLGEGRLADAAVLDELLAKGAPEAARLPVLLGLREDPREPVWLDVADTDGVCFVAGPAGSGKTTALRAAAAGAASAGLDVVVIAPPGSPLVDAPPPGAREAELTSDPEDLLAAGGRPTLVVVDDLHDLGDQPELRDTLGRPPDGLAVVAAADLSWLKTRFHGLAGAVRRPRQGLLLSPPTVTNGVEMFGTRLDRSDAGPLVPGRGVARVAQEQVVVHVARPSDHHGAVETNPAAGEGGAPPDA